MKRILTCLGTITLITILLASLTPQISSEEMTLEELQIKKIEKEISLLENQAKVSENEFVSTFFKESLALIGIVAGGTVAAFFAWKRERSKPTQQDQVKAFNDAIIETNFEQYLPIWEEYWKSISSVLSEEDQDKDIIKKVVGDTWKKIPKKGTPEEDAEDEKIWNDTMNFAWKKAERMKLNHIQRLGTLQHYKKTMTYLKKIAKVRYYEKVNKLLPTLVSTATTSTYKSKYKLDEENDLNKWKDDALTCLKILMIFSFLRENDKVIEIMIESEINKIILEKTGGKQD